MCKHLSTLSEEYCFYCNGGYDKRKEEKKFKEEAKKK